MDTSKGSYKYMHTGIYEEVYTTDDHTPAILKVLYNPMEFSGDIREILNIAEGRNGGVWDDCILGCIVSPLEKYPMPMALTFCMLAIATFEPFVASVFVNTDPNPERAVAFLRYMACAMMFRRNRIVSPENAEQEIRDMILDARYVYAVGPVDYMNSFVINTNGAIKDSIPILTHDNWWAPTESEY
jgi:hypothetical protein